MSLIGSVSGIDTATLTAHETGDLIVVWAFSRDTGLPVIPSGFTQIKNLSGVSFGVLAYKYAESNSEVLGTWTNATSLNALIYRSGGELSIGNSLIFSDWGTLISYPSLTLQNTDNTSIVASFLGHRSFNIDVTQTPNSSSLLTSYVNSGVSVSAAYDTVNPVSSYPADDVEVSGSGNTWVGVVVEIKESISTVIIDDTTDPLNSKSQAVINGSGFEVAQGGGVVLQKQGARSTPLTVNSWSDSQINVNALDVESTNYSYGTHSLMVTVDGGDSGSIDFEAVPAVNHNYVVIDGLSTVNDRFKSIPDFTVDDQLVYQSVLFKDGLPTVYTVNVNSNGTFSIDGSTPVGSYTFTVRAWDHTDETWGDLSTQTVEITTDVAVESDILISMVGISDGDYLIRVFREDTGALVHNGLVTFANEQVTLTLTDVPVGVYTTTFLTDGSVDPDVYGADKGVTQ